MVCSSRAMLLLLCVLFAASSLFALCESAALTPPSAPDSPVPANACELPKDTSCLVPPKPPAGSCLAVMRSLVAGKSEKDKARYARYVCGVQPGAGRKMMFAPNAQDTVDKLATSCRAVAFAILRLHGYEYTNALMNGYPTSCGDSSFHCMGKQFHDELASRVAKKQSTLIHLRITDARVGEHRLTKTVTIGHHVVVEMTFSPEKAGPEFVVLQAFEDFHTLDEWLYPCTFNRKYFCSLTKTVPKPKEVNQIVDLMNSPWAGAKVFDQNGIKPYFANLEALHSLLSGFNGKTAEDGVEISCDALDKPYSANFAVSIKQFAPQGKCRLVPPAYPKGSEPPYLGVFYRMLDYKLDRCQQTVKYIKDLPNGKQCVADPVDKNLVDICV